MVRLHGEPSYLEEENQRNPEASSGTKSRTLPPFTSRYTVSLKGLMKGEPAPIISLGVGLKRLVRTVERIIDEYPG
jgi:hypothetical protein